MITYPPLGHQIPNRYQHYLAWRIDPHDGRKSLILPLFWRYSLVIKFRSRIPLFKWFTPSETRTTKVEQKARGVCGWEYVWLEIYVVWLHFNGSGRSKWIKIIFGVSIYIFTPFVFMYVSNFSFLHLFWFFWQTDRSTKKGGHRSSVPSA